MGRVKVTHTVGQTLRPIPARWRRLIKAEHRKQTGGPPVPLNDAGRLVLANAIFEIENKLESSRAERGLVQSPAVETMRMVRNVLLDDCGENEPHPQGLRSSKVDAMAAEITAGKKKRRPPATEEAA
jgi:hypothetical protein